MSAGLQSSGQISFSDLRNEMGATGAQVSYSSLYRGAGYTPSTATSVPTTGQISFTNFYGAKKWNFTTCNYPVAELSTDIYPSVNDANSKLIWADPVQYTVTPITGYPINFQCIYKNTTTSAQNTNIYFQADNYTTLKVNNTTVGTYTYDGSSKMYNVSLPIGANLISFSNTSNASGAYTANPGGLKMALRDSGNTTSYIVSNSNTFRSDTQCVVHPNNYYTATTSYKSGSFTPVTSGTNPDVQYQLGAKNIGSSVGAFYATQRLQDFSVLDIGFEFYLDGIADAMWLNIGGTGISGFEQTTNGGFNLIIEMYIYASIAQGIHLVNNNDTVVASYSTSSIVNASWWPLNLRYTRSTGEWQVWLNGTSILTYTNPNNSSWLSSSGNYWYIAARTGGLTGDFLVRRMCIYGR